MCTHVMFTYMFNMYVHTYVHACVYVITYVHYIRTYVRTYLEPTISLNQMLVSTVLCKEFFATNSQAFVTGSSDATHDSHYSGSLWLV